MRPLARVALGAILSLVLTVSAVAEERLVLKSGREVIGTIVSRDEIEIVVRTGAGPLTFAADQVVRVEPIRRPEPAPKPAPVPVRPRVELSAETLAAMRGRVLVAFGGDNPLECLRAAGEIVAAWPASEVVLDEALHWPLAPVRLEAVHLLEKPELGDTAARVLHAMSDGDAAVRAAAIRIVRHRQMLGFQSAIARVVQDDGSWAPRHEALRTLEDMGTVAAVAPVFAGFAAERDVTKRLAYRRVLRKLVGTDCGDDVEAWRQAVDRAVALTRRSHEAK